MWNNYANQGNVIIPAEKKTQHTETHTLTLVSDPC